MQFLSNQRGADFCPSCGEKLRWIRLITGMWIAANEEPILYIPGQGKMWLIEYVKWDAVILKDCLIFKPGKEMNIDLVQKAYEPHVFSCTDRDNYIQQRKEGRLWQKAD